MARGKGTANLAASLEVLAGAPLDARDICPTVADLYVAANWTYKYIGMKTTVQATGDTYRLVNLDVTQESSWVKEGSGSSGGGHTIEGDGTAVTDRDTLNFKDMSVSDDSTNEKTDVKPHRLTQSELADIISPLPFFDFSNPGAEAFIFSTNERIIGQWIDGKPLYQKTISGLSLTLKGNVDVDVSSLSIEQLVDSICLVNNGSIAQMKLPVLAGIDAWYKPNTLKFRVSVSNDAYVGNSLIITLRYTKTTDQPVATGEKIVGQWIDGKALYEKTGTFTSADYESGTTTWQFYDLLSLPDTITVVDVSGFISTPSYGIAPIGSKNKIDNSRYWDSCFNYKKRIVFNNQVGSSLSESINITVRYTKT